MSEAKDAMGTIEGWPEQGAYSTAPRPPGGLGRGAARRIALVMVLTLIMGTILLLSAGTLGWMRAWVWLAAQGILMVVNGAILLAVNPEVINERGKRHQGTKKFDRILTAAITPWYFGIPLVAGLDVVRFGWTSLPLWAMWIGLVLLSISDVFALWSMVVNRHLETSVRIQEDRGHVVVTSGPYRLVRHPMYVGMCLQILSWPLILGSGWALVPTLAVIVLFVVRTSLEDRTLHAELPGYGAYTLRTRYRLLPGIW